VLEPYLFNMKFIITENKIIDVIKHYLDSKNYKQINVRDALIYFYKEGEFLADIVVDADIKFVELNFELTNELRNFFSIDRGFAVEIIRSWIEDVTGIEELEAWSPSDYHRSTLYLPNTK
jgi:hypothetical protein